MILFKDIEDGIADAPVNAPDFFADLNLDQIVAAVTAGKEEYNLAPFFYAPLHAVDAVTFRHEVMQDLEDADLFNNINAFGQRMHTVRAYLAELEKRYCEHQKERWFLDAVDMYCDAVERLAEDLSIAKLRSRGFLAFTDYVKQYVASTRFAALVDETKQLEGECRRYATASSSMDRASKLGTTRGTATIARRSKLHLNDSNRAVPQSMISGSATRQR